MGDPKMSPSGLTREITPVHHPEASAIIVHCEAIVVHPLRD
jgi:hypothetical protein